MVRLERGDGRLLPEFNSNEVILNPVISNV